ncbi:uncharacterized protein [Antedon mediterranea]|uniref:uncharacterized protein n=1 Tax=Antedon mediterranea TaxID=105859 RepID=UPI003AF5C64B
MLRIRDSFWIFSICIYFFIVFQVSQAQNGVKEDILDLLNEIKNEEHKSLQQLREDLLWKEHPVYNNAMLETENNPKLKRQNSQHILWSKLGKVRTGSDSISSLRQTGKRTPWFMEAEQLEYPYLPSHKTTKKADSQHRLWTMVGDATDDRVTSLSDSGKRALPRQYRKKADSQQRLWTMVGDATDDRVTSLSDSGKRAMAKRPNAHQTIWSKMGSVLQNNDRMSAIAETGKRTATGEQFYINTLKDLYRDPKVLASLKAIVNQDSTLTGQPSKLDESDYIEDILRQQETNDF